MKNKWRIEFLCVDTWEPLVGFDNMAKSYAQGAWDMLTSLISRKYKHRLINGDEVVDEHTTDEIRRPGGGGAMRVGLSGRR